MREITRELVLLAPNAVFSLLHRPSAIREWWSAARVIFVARPGGLCVAAWGPEENAPEYVTSARILAWEPPERLRFGQFEYYTRDGGGLPFAAPLETEFTVRAVPDGAVLRVRQSGFPNSPVADGFYAACQQGWEATFSGIQRFVAIENPRFPLER